MSAGLVAKSGLGDRTEDVRAGDGLAVCVGPSEILVEKFAESGGVTFRGGLNKFVVGLKGSGFLSCGGLQIAERCQQDENREAEHVVHSVHARDSFCETLYAISK